MNRRQFLIGSLTAAVAAIVAPALKHLPAPISDEIFGMARYIQRLYERRLLGTDLMIMQPHIYVSISEFIHAR